jgi:hypothetical protein
MLDAHPLRKLRTDCVKEADGSAGSRRDDG